jgi:isochorismate synthase
LFGTWFGATPELLLNTVENQWNTMALAGTRSSTSQEAWEEKEVLEHQYVIDAVVEALHRSGAEDIEIEETIEKIAGPVKHLYTPISFILRPQFAEHQELLHLICYSHVKCTNANCTPECLAG